LLLRLHIKRSRHIRQDRQFFTSITVFNPRINRNPQALPTDSSFRHACFDLEFHPIQYKQGFFSNLFSTAPAILLFERKRDARWQIQSLKGVSFPFGSPPTDCQWMQPGDTTFSAQHTIMRCRRIPPVIGCQYEFKEASGIVKIIAAYGPVKRD